MILRAQRREFILIVARRRGGVSKRVYALSEICAGRQEISSAAGQCAETLCATRRRRQRRRPFSTLLNKNRSNARSIGNCQPPCVYLSKVQWNKKKHKGFARVLLLSASCELMRAMCVVPARRERSVKLKQCEM